MASTYSANFHGRPHVDAKLLLKAWLSRTHRLRTSSENGLLRIPGAEWFELQIGRLLAGARVGAGPSSSVATSAVRRVWCEAPAPRPVSAWKYSWKRTSSLQRGSSR